MPFQIHIKDFDGNIAIHQYAGRYTDAEKEEVRRAVVQSIEVEIVEKGDPRYKSVIIDR